MFVILSSTAPHKNSQNHTAFELKKWPTPNEISKWSSCLGCLKFSFWEDILMSDLCNWKERWSSGWTEVGRMFKVCKMFYWGGVGWDNFDKNCDLNCTLEKKGLCIDETKGEDHTGLRKIYLERSGPKLKKIQARLELPTPASSTPEISVVAPRDCGVAFYSEVASASLGVNSILIAEQKLKVSISPLF